MGKCRQEGDNDAACNEGVLCCQCATASLSPITSDGLSCLFFLTTSMNNPSLAPSPLTLQ